MTKSIFRVVFTCLEPLIAVVFLVAAIIARFCNKPIDIGLGPLPLINNVYHKQVFESLGYSAETFVHDTWHITSEFDIRGDLYPTAKIPYLGIRITLWLLAIRALFRYKCLLIYFNGGPLGLTSSTFLWRLEPFLYKIANLKTIVLAYGTDVQAMSRSQNLAFKDAMSKDYPDHHKNHKNITDKIDLWTSHGTHTVSGCEWVDYMHHWDTLMISHFSIDVDLWTSQNKDREPGPFRVFHAPNHKAVKGTQHLVDAVENLKAEGLDIELLLVQKKPNHEVRALIEKADVVVDQLIVGWYAMFAIEAMALKKPVICYLRQDLIDLYKTSGLLSKSDDIPLISASPLTIENTLKELYEKHEYLREIGENGRKYVMSHHSIEAIAKSFKNIAIQTLGEKH